MGIFERYMHPLFVYLVLVLRSMGFCVIGFSFWFLGAEDRGKLQRKNVVYLSLFL